ncbi:hypothetical protein LQ954_10700 [Sphingomonas sp. IC-11]|uniref:hypothetical protein n=1 Tax=Sphingomonas sp. IC-11 TaxID=2898528 RepID=UPI001E5E71DE|nr:hypothetical protein [Sphingomonas sp. IC-11]MCD2316617.1 hypothetical protein [Sphingomonas sp. IC-11]
MLGDMPEPVIDEGWLRVKITHASLNRHDVFTRCSSAIPRPLLWRVLSNGRGADHPDPLLPPFDAITPPGERPRMFFEVKWRRFIAGLPVDRNASPGGRALVDVSDVIRTVPHDRSMEVEDIGVIGRARRNTAA